MQRPSQGSLYISSVMIKILPNLENKSGSVERIYLEMDESTNTYKVGVIALMKDLRVQVQLMIASSPTSSISTVSRLF